MAQLKSAVCLHLVLTALFPFLILGSLASKDDETKNLENSKGSYCPTGYIKASTECLYPKTLPLVFSLDFASFEPFNSSIFRLIASNNSNVSDSKKSKNILITDKGFIFEKTSALINIEDFIPAENFSAKMWIKSFNPGIVFRILDESELFIIKTLEDGFEMQLKVFDRKSNSLEYIKIESKARNNIWHNVAIAVKYSIESIELIDKLGLRNKQEKCELFKANLIIKIDKEQEYNKELLHCTSLFSQNKTTFTWLFGDVVSSFEGFLYRFVFINTFDTELLPYNNIPIWLSYNQLNMHSPRGLQDSLLLNVNFNLIQDPFYDSVQNIIVQSGSSSAFYPSYSADDARATKRRGYYFLSTSYVTIDDKISPIISIPENFSVSLYLLIFSDGIIFTRKNSDSTFFELSASSGLKLKFFVTPTQIEFYVDSFIYKKWAMIEILKHSFGSLGTLYFCINLICLEQETSSNIDDLSNSYMQLGDPKNGFVGYIWDLKVYNAIVYSGLSIEFTCVHPDWIDGCLSECYFNEFEDENCTKCPLDCQDSCGTIHKCTLCEDPLCKLCPHYTECYECIENSSLDNISGQCKCNHGYFGDICEPCHHSCADCTNGSSLDCIECAANYFYFPDYLLCIPINECPTAFTELSSSCTLTDPSCIYKTVFNQISNNYLDEINSISTKSGNSNNYYPDYESTDVIAAKGRGVYFIETSYMTISNDPRILLGPEFTFKFWILFNGQGRLITRKSHSNEMFTVDLNDEISISVICFSSTYSGNTIATITNNVWHLLEIAKRPLNNWETFEIYIDSNRYYFDLNDYYIDETSSISTIIGGQASFIGFLWSLEIYNEFFLSPFTDAGYCIHPIDMNECLPTCLINEIYESSCIICNVDCEYTCGSSKYCTLCDDVLCEICPNYTTCETCKDLATYEEFSGQCKCEQGYGLRAEICEPCHETCQECTTPDFKDCTICINNYLMFPDISRCIPIEVCPTHYGSETICQLIQSSLIFSLTFNQIQDPFNDIISLLPVYSGSDSNYYPDYTNDDVYSARDRGVYFRSSSFMTIGEAYDCQLIFAPKFTIAFWALINEDGDLLYKYDIYGNLFRVYYFLGIKFEITTLSGVHICCSSSLEYENSWTLFVISKDVVDYGEVISIKANDILSSMSIDNYYKESIMSSIILGGNGNSFQGFLWSLEIYNDLVTIDYDSGIDCVYPKDFTSCLPTCKISEFYIGTTCETCLGECAASCGFSFSCNICDNIICTKCKDYTHCEECTENAYIDLGLGTCKCKKKYLNVNEACLSCHFSCAECDSIEYTGCLSCELNFLMFSDFNRCLPAYKCPNNYGIYNICTYNGTAEVLSVIFNKIQNQYFDAVGKISLESGRGSMYYPEYEGSDAISTVTRGLYFHHGSYMRLGKKSESNLIFGPEFTISMWINIKNHGSIFSRTNYTMKFINIFTNSKFVFNITSLNGMESLESTNGFSLNVWYLFEVTKELNGDGEMIGVHIDSVSNYMSYSSYYRDQVKSVTTLLGNSILGFEGFLWSLDISNKIKLQTFISSALCIYPPSLSSCIPDCSIAAYYDLDTNSCKSCLPKCSTCMFSNKCSMCSDSLCNYCPNYNECIQCKENSTIVGTTCMCDHDFVYDEDKEECIELKCFPGCYTCSNSSIYDCLKCDQSNVRIQDVCLKLPSGYELSGSEYLPFIDIIFSIKLKDILGVVRDSVFSVPVLTGNSIDFYPDKDDEDPIPVFKRGYFFDGISSLMRTSVFKNFTSPTLNLPPSWGMQIWFLPFFSDSILLYSSSSVSDLFKVSFNEGLANIVITLATTDRKSKFSYFSFNSSEIITIEQWNSLYIYLKYGSPYELKIYINNQQDLTFTLGNGIFPNILPDTNIVIGGISQIKYFTGYVYSLEFYSNEIYFVRSRNIAEKSCLLPIDGECLPNCLFNYLWIGPNYDDCAICESYCPYSCVREDSCNLCYDILCKTCNNYDDGSCTQCIQYASMQNDNCKCQLPSYLDVIKNICIICNSDQYYNNITCTNCPDQCATCDNNAYCSSCVSHAYLVQGSCFCFLGFFGKDRSCIESTLNVSLKILTYKSVLLEFDKDLANKLTKDDISVEACQTVTFDITYFNFAKYYVHLKFRRRVPENCFINITFNNPKSIISVENGYLSLSYIDGILFSGSDTDSELYITRKAASEKLSISVTTGSTATTASTSIFNTNPACLWSFISFIQMLCFIDIGNAEFSPKFSGYIKGLKKYNIFPNFFIDAIPESSGKVPFQKAVDYGYKTNLLLINAGNYLSALLTMLGALLLTLFLSRFKKFRPLSYKLVSEAIDGVIKSYKYGAILRFWITCYLEIIACSLIAIVTPFDNTSVQITNLVFASIILVIYIKVAIISTPVVFFYFSFTNKELIVHDSDEINANYGTLFYEFNNDKGLARSQYYFYYFVRRIIYMSIQFFMRDYPLTQLTLNIVLSITVSIT